jgi:hypothetical protein
MDIEIGDHALVDKRLPDEVAGEFDACPKNPDDGRASDRATAMPSDRRPKQPRSIRRRG